MRLGVKIGSQALTNGKGIVNYKLIERLCEQIAELMWAGHEVFIVSSGAVASESDNSLSRNLQAAIGQPKLINYYRNSFSPFGIKVAQMLITDRDLNSKGPFRRTIEEGLIHSRVIPVINANDVKSDTELCYLDKCADNDELFKALCLFLDVDLAITIFCEKGVLNPRGKVIHRAKLKHKDEILSYANGGSDLGYGKCGMKTKIKSLFEMVDNGISCWLVSHRGRNVILDIVKGVYRQGTEFTP